MNKEELIKKISETDDSVIDIFDEFKIRVANKIYEIEEATKTLTPNFAEYDPKDIAYHAAFGSPEEQEWGAAFKEAYDDYIGE